jgi:SAM-dependent methyltransferase
MGALDAARRRLAADPRKRAWWHRLRHPALLVARRSTEPLSHNWGFERGTPIDRYYIERFLERHRGDIRGRVLEVKDDAYTRRYGSGVERADVIDVDAGNPRATVIADLAAADAVPAGAFDCFVLTQTLQLIHDVAAVARHAHRILAPGGVLLVTVPAVSRLAGDPDSYPDHWRFTGQSARRLFEDAFGAGNAEVRTDGNALAGAAFLLGMAAEELGARRLDAADPSHPVLVTIRAVKAATDRGSAI